MRRVGAATRRVALWGAVTPALVAAACAPGPGGGAGSAARPGTLKTDVTVPFLQTSGQAEQGLVNQVAERWQQAHPRGPRAEFVISTGDVVEKFTTMLAGGTPPALVSMDSTQGVRFSDQGEMVALDDNIKRDRYDLADYIPVSLDQYRWQGKLYALLRDFSHQSLWVNTDMFSREGLTPPAGDYSTTTGGWTFDQFVETARRLTKSDGGAAGLAVRLRADHGAGGRVRRSSPGRTAPSCSIRTTRSAWRTTSGWWRGCRRCWTCASSTASRPTRRR